MEWIDVINNPPTKEGDYIVAYDDGRVGDNTWVVDHYFGEESHWSYRGYEHITHYMPKPLHPNKINISVELAKE